MKTPTCATFCYSFSRYVTYCIYVCIRSFFDILDKNYLLTLKWYWMKKVIVVRLENVLVKKFNVESSFRMLVKRMEKQKKDVEGLKRAYEEEMGKSWEKMKKKELLEKYENEFERKEIYREGKRVLGDLLALRRENESLQDMRVVVVSGYGGREVRRLLMNNELEGKEVEVKKFKEGELGDCLRELGVKREEFGKVIVLSNSDKDILECEKVGVKCEMCGWGKIEGIGMEDIYGVIGLRKG